MEHESGVARIKPEYILPDHERKVALDCISEADKLQLGNLVEKLDADTENGTNNEASLEPPSKKVRLTKFQKRKLSGQNKARPLPYTIPREKSLCYSVSNVGVDDTGPVPCTREKCVFIHDFQEYLKVKPQDVGPVCYVYSLQGRCPRGLTCRYGSQHTDSNGRNIFDESIAEKYEAAGLKTYNSLTKDIQVLLWKRKYNFDKSEAVIKQFDKEKLLPPRGKDVVDEKKGAETIEPAVDGNEEKKLGPCPDQDLIPTRQAEKIVLDWRDKLYLSPLTTVGNLPFRRICKEFGVDITCGEMAMSSSLLRGQAPEWALVKRHETEKLFGVQLCGNNPYTMSRAAQLIEEQTDANFIDINLGCPIELVYRNGEGSGLLNRDKILCAVVTCMSRSVALPVTCKMRTGVQSAKNLAHLLVPKFRDWGASMITVHGRSREQRYTKSANWPYIEECAQLASPLPLFLNGDILSFHDYERARSECPTVAGAMVGRGALIKPWLFTEIRERRDWDISSAERLDMLRRFSNYGLEHWGTDTKGVENTRRFLLEWLSFLHRYIPVGLLECPQKINDRPPYYKGRDELETLMASPNCADWIKISELLLGPIPDDYHFLPKHKANSWK